MTAVHQSARLPFVWEVCENYLTIEPLFDPWYKTALKVVSYMTVILPVLAMSVRTVYRYLYPDSYFRFWVDQFKHAYAKRMRPLPFDEIIKAKQKTPHAELVISNALSNSDAYRSNQKTVVTILYEALLDCAQEKNLDFALKIYKKAVSFYRKNKKMLIFDENDIFPLVMHRGFIHLLKQLRKQVKLHFKWEKIQKKFNPSETQIFLKALNYLKLTWIHGTKAYTLDAARRYTNDEIIPTGELKKRQVAQLSGEMISGITGRGINQKSLSGVALSAANLAIIYAQNNKFSKGAEIGSYESLLKTEDFDNLDDFSHFFASQVEAIRRIKNLYPEYIEEDKENFEKVIKQIYAKVQSRYFPIKNQNSAGCLFDLLMALEELEHIVRTPASAPIVNSNEQILAQIPTVLASKTVYGSPLNLYPQFATLEEPYPGSLKMGKDIQVIFTTKEHIEEVSALTQADVKVEEIAVLESAQKLEKTLAPYLYKIA